MAEKRLFHERISAKKFLLLLPLLLSFSRVAVHVFFLWWVENDDDEDDGNGGNNKSLLHTRGHATAVDPEETEAS